VTDGAKALLLRWLLVAALLLPLVTIVAGIVSAERHLARSSEWVFEIDGYDPRDLLRGRYVEFRLNLREESATGACIGPATEACCYCLERRGTAIPPRVTRTTCSDAASCDGRLRVDKANKTHRYYVPEQRARQIEMQLIEAAQTGDAHVVLAIDARGTPQIVELRLGGVPVRGAGSR
jgi:uncharacterized membrane-anchored protein